MASAFKFDESRNGNEREAKGGEITRTLIKMLDFITASSDYCETFYSIASQEKLRIKEKGVDRLCEF